MQIVNHIKRFVLILLLTMLAWVGYSQSQVVQNQTTFDLKPLHFGYRLGIVSLGGNSVFHTESPIRGDMATLNPAFTAGVVASLRINRFMNLRAVPGLALGQRIIKFNGEGPEPFGENDGTQFSRNSTYVELPLNLKFKTERINNYRPYLMAGCAYRFDIGKTKPEDLLQFNPHSFYFEAGIGLDYYFEFFRFGTELKISLGLNNILGDPPDGIKQIADYHKAYASYKPNMVTLSFFFE